jgi:hypothetical protein
MQLSKIVFIFFASVVLLSSCSFNPDRLGMSESEQRGISEIMTVWGPTSIKKGFSASTKEGNSNYVEIEVTNREIFFEDAKLEPIARGVAFLFFKNLTQDEQASYGKYQIILKNDSGRSANFSYPSHAVKRYFEKEKIANEYYTRLLQGDLEYIYNNIDNPGFPIDTVINVFTPLLNQVKSFDRIATDKILFVKYNLQNGNQIEAMKFAGNIIDKDNVIKCFSISIDPEKNQKNIIEIRFWDR